MDATAPQGSRRAAIVWIALVSAAAAATVGGWAVRDLLRDPQVYLLVASDGAEWIVFPSAASMGLRRNAEYSARFTTEFTLEAVPPEALLHFRAFRSGTLHLDGRPVVASAPPLDRWKQRRSVDLAPYLTPGRHVLEFAVTNHSSYPALWAVSPALGLASDASWGVRTEGTPWVHARSAHRFEGPAPLADRFEPSHRALLRLWFVHLPLGALAVLACALHDRGRPVWIRRLVPNPSALRWLLLGAWGVMCANNLLRLPSDIGFDVRHHLDYIRFIAAEGRLPLATDGWEMFQAPLYYLASLPLHQLLSQAFDADGVRSWLRILPMLCGLLHVEIAYRAMCTAFPGRAGLQGLGLLAAALLPMNLLVSQTLGNEGMSAVLTGLGVLLVLRAVAGARAPETRHGWVALGFVWGLALLAKSTALLLAPAIVAALWVCRRRDASPASEGRLLLRSAAAVFGTALLVAGWFYLRNWLELGRPFHLGWDPALGIAWWHDPGYRTPESLLRFGRAVVQPVNAVHYGFWDGFYSSLWSDGYLASRVEYAERPPWNYGFMLAGALLAVVPSALLVLGAARALLPRRGPLERCAGIAALCVAAYLAALLYHYLRIPLYSITKASYTAGLAACYGILIAAGFDTLGRIRGLRPLLWGIAIPWAFSAYAAFFVLPT